MPSILQIERMKIDATIERMRKVRREDQGGKNHLKVAQLALDKIIATKEYKFGDTLFKELVKTFTDVKDELETMRKKIKSHS